VYVRHCRLQSEMTEAPSNESDDSLDYFRMVTINIDLS
jgi:hypothetical protein